MGDTFKDIKFSEARDLKYEITKLENQINKDKERLDSLITKRENILKEIENLKTRIYKATVKDNSGS